MTFLPATGALVESSASGVGAGAGVGAGGVGVSVGVTVVAVLGGCNGDTGVTWFSSSTAFLMVASLVAAVDAGPPAGSGAGAS